MQTLWSISTWLAFLCLVTPYRALKADDCSMNKSLFGFYAEECRYIQCRLPRGKNFIGTILFRLPQYPLTTITPLIILENPITLSQKWIRLNDVRVELPCSPMMLWIYNFNLTTEDLKGIDSHDQVNFRLLDEKWRAVVCAKFNLLVL
ncbi:hypothetical protein CRM22_006693 [Opisthorchis felineus]|uniref:Uncharacterized protein n=1 Tax=Opisthorchis felineus TaxID=147828 RepID=A0A4S2LSH8_OPIFE|nr:hypothetical protein CRM22_006693 [Opisthorchis felineus]